MLSDPTPANEFDAEFEVFFLEHHDDTLRSLDAILNDHEAAIDATQDAFIKAHARWSVIRTYDAPQAWVRRIAINASRDRLRSERRRRDRETRVDPVDEPPASDPIVADAGIQALLDDLPTRRARNRRTLLCQRLQRGRDRPASRAQRRHGQVAAVGGP